MEGRQVMGLRGQSVPGKLERLAEGGNRHSGKWVQMLRSCTCPNKAPTLVHCGSPLLQEVMILVDEVEVNVDDVRGVILVEAESEDDVRVTAL